MNGAGRALLRTFSTSHLAALMEFWIVQEQVVQITLVTQLSSAWHSPHRLKITGIWLEKATLEHLVGL